MNQDAGFYAAGGLLLLACLLKLPALVRVRGRDTYLLAICALLLGGSGVLFLAAPRTIITLNRVTGVSNFSAPLVYAMLDLFAGASVLLVLNWRGGPDAEQTRRLSRWTIGAYCGVVTLLVLLYWAGDASVERRTTFDTYYANTPFLREMITLYLAAHLVASLTVSGLCWRWSREVRGTLRWGLGMLTLGYLLHVGYDVAKGAAVVARWAGTDWDVLSTGVAPQVAQPSAFLVAVGFILPLIGKRFEQSGTELRRYVRLARLARELDRVEAPSVSLTIPWWKPEPRLRLTQRQTHISDRVMTCRPYLDTRVRDEVSAAVLAGGMPRERAVAVAEASMLVAAIETRGAAAVEGARPSDGPVFASDLAEISRALDSPHVTRIRRRFRALP